MKFEIEFISSRFFSSHTELSMVKNLLILVNQYVASRFLRPSDQGSRIRDQGLLAVPHTRSKTKGDRAFETVASRLWSASPHDLIDTNLR